MVCGWLLRFLFAQRHCAVVQAQLQAQFCCVLRVDANHGSASGKGGSGVACLHSLAPLVRCEPFKHGTVVPGEQ